MKSLGDGMKCSLSLLADDTNLGAVVDTLRSKIVPFSGILIRWTLGSVNLMMFNKDRCKVFHL